MNGVNRHLSYLGNCSVSDLSHIIRQILIGSLKSLLPEPRQPDPATVSVNIPHVPHHLLSLLHFLGKTSKPHPSHCAAHPNPLTHNKNNNTRDRRDSREHRDRRGWEDPCRWKGNSECRTSAEKRYR